MPDIPAASPAAPPRADATPVQRVVKVRRDYNSWVARETLEDYALRFTPHSFRRWSELRVANTAFGAAAFLVLEAVGGALLVEYGFWNALWAILATGLIIFLAGIPISRYAARYGLDMDLLTRGAGFGYLGSTITSLIYASFTFIFFALEAAIMAYALDLAFDIPPVWGYLLCALVIIPLVTHGVTAISWLQVITQPLWFLMLVVPFAYVLSQNPAVVDGMIHYPGKSGQFGQFDLTAFGAALTVGIALITQMGEQVDYLRFMPERTAANRRRWNLAVLIGGPGWVVPGVIKMLGGALLAYLAISHSVPPERAVDPNQMYLVAYEYVFSKQGWAVAATALFVVISQLKINVTNAYAGSLAWSNFFARLTHSHPGRVVWVVFNTLIALVLMELDVFQALGRVLGLYSNIAISWIMAVVADLVINKPLGLSPKGIEFKRAHLYDINPVGVGAMLLASLLSVSAYFGLFGDTAQAFSALIALVTAMVAAPLIAWATGGRYYIARPAEAGATGHHECVVCERHYEADDISGCPAYGGSICSLCCALDARCHDQCKPHARISAQWTGAMQRLLPPRLWPYLDTGIGHFVLLMAAILPFLALLLGMLYYHELRVLGSAAEALGPALRLAFVKTFAALVLVAAVVAWWLVLTHKSRQVAQEESNRQTALLMQEIEDHRRTDEALQQAKQAAELANRAKSRYITGISHELRTPLNSILGYAQILDGDPSIPPQRQQAIRVIRRSGDHLLSLIEGTLDIARIEGGKLTLDVRPIDFPAFLQQIVHMFEPQAAGKGLGFDYEIAGTLPAVVRADEKRLRQILINLLGNAVKFTARGRVRLAVSYAREMATFHVEDTGPGIGAEDAERVFEPFGRGGAAGGTAGSGLGLTISRMFADVMGGELHLERTSPEGTRFTVRLFLPQVHGAEAQLPAKRSVRRGYLGPRRRILVVDNEPEDRQLLASVLEPLGFEVAQAASGLECLKMIGPFAPDIIFMDLAMPGIDGWETIRRIRALGSGNAAIAVISANAFDKGLDNDVALPPQDFLVKPVRMDDLLDWIGTRLPLEWIADAPAPGGAPGDALILPPAAMLDALADPVEMGYVRGILEQLDTIERADGRYRPFADKVRQLAGQFRFDAIMTLISQDADL
ncbi:response regulator [Nitrogeniibacter mangrovi]|uniref:histidine kinase n=1 Tax=Nitrogeniibacter mangrovi TaxID=2016596 RepID=A0A6C1B245_9RHOO|nr:ATP-binding protein [Nitrogeniibacter mangrovi]QID17443.1 response regulator [Nitrogeniibacter mangrovi]